MSLLSPVLPASIVTAFFCGACKKCHPSLLWCMHQLSLLSSVMPASIVTALSHVICQSPVMRVLIVTSFSCGTYMNCHCFLLSCGACINCPCSPLSCGGSVNGHCSFLWCLHQLSLIYPVVHVSIVTPLSCGACIVSVLFCGEYINCYCFLISCGVSINCHSSFLMCIHQLSLLFRFVWCQCQFSLLSPVVPDQLLLLSSVGHA